MLVDRVNVGGSESGQQSAFRAPGVSGNQNDFQMDGTSITDMAATGASPTYYDFDQFAEMSFTTGGTDVTKNSAGVQVNLVTKRGSNEFRGSARFYNTQRNGYFGGKLAQAQPNIDGELYKDNFQTELAGAQVRKIEDIGFEAGGAAIQDRLFFWGSWGQNDIQQNAATGLADDTILENTALKANGQINASNSIVGSFNNGDKLKFGRGAGTTRPAPTTWNQRGPSAPVPAGGHARVLGELLPHRHVLARRLRLRSGGPRHSLGRERTPSGCARPAPGGRRLAGQLPHGAAVPARSTPTRSTRPTSSPRARRSTTS